ncbi:MAG: hypothetical protein Q7K16_01720 [Candidatus Azambacteria bacterium]|nr:hypothetical protein [Candidatus Azambacteria bacterium]
MNQKTIFAILGVVVIILIGTTVYLAMTKNVSQPVAPTSNVAQQPTPTPVTQTPSQPVTKQQPTAQPTDETGSWQTYINKPYGFKVSYPNYWTFSERSIGGNDIGIDFRSSEKIQNGCDIDSRGDVGENPFACPGNGFVINVMNSITRDKYIDSFAWSKLKVSQTLDTVISENIFTKIIFTSGLSEYLIEKNGVLLIFSSIGAYNRSEQMILSTFKFIK